MNTKTNIQLSDKNQKNSDKILYVILLAVLGIFLIAFLLVKFAPSFDNGPLTLREMNEKNIGENLDQEDMYMYNGYSFVNYKGVWYTQLYADGTIYDVTLNYGPKDLENISIEGNLSTSFLEKKQMYLTFDPNGGDLEHIAIATFGLSNSLIRAFGVEPVAACTDDSVGACSTAPVVDCSSENKSVFFFKQSNISQVVLEDNCVIIEGQSEDIVKAKDRLLLRWYGILD